MPVPTPAPLKSAGLAVSLPLLFPPRRRLPRAACAGSRPSSPPIYPIESPIPVLPDITADVRGRERGPSRGAGGAGHRAVLASPSPCTSSPSPCPAVLSPWLPAQEERRPWAAAVPARRGQMRAALPLTRYIWCGFWFPSRSLPHPPRPAGGEEAPHLEAIAAVTLQGDAAPQSREHDTAPQQPLPARAASPHPNQMRRAGARWVLSPSREGQRAPAPARGWEQARG